MKYSILVSITILLLSGDVVGQLKKKKPSQNSLTPDVQLKVETSVIEAEKQLLLENYARAYELFLVARDLNPNDAAIHFKLAEVVVQQGDNEKGLEYISKSIELDPDNKFYLIFKAEILKNIGRFIDAIATYERLISTVSGTESYLYELAVLYQYQQQYENALKTYRKAEEYFGRTIEVMREKQSIYLKLGDIEQLIKDWEALVAESPYEPGYLIEFCRVLIDNEMYQDAEARLQDFVSNNPELDRPFILLSEIERRLGNTKEALDYLERPIKSSLVDLRPKLQALNSYSAEIVTEDQKRTFQRLVSYLVEAHPDEYEAMAFAGDMSMQEGEKETALMYYRKAAAINPGNYNIWQNIVTLEIERAEYDSLVEHAETALEYFPNQAIFYFYGGVGYYFQENYRRSTQLLEQGRRFTSDPALLSVFYGQLGDAYHSMKEYEKSDDAYEKAIENDPNNDHALNNYSYYLSVRGINLDRALEMSSALIDMHPENPTYLDTHGWVLYIMQRYTEAEEYLRKAVERGEDGTVYEHYGDVLYKLGRTDEALEYWQRARDLGGASDKIDQKITDKQLYE